MRKLTLVLFFILVSVSALSQYRYRDSNRIGISFGGNQFSLNTNNFDAKPGLGWNAGLSMRGNFYNNWEMVYSMQFSENNFSVATINSSSGREDVAYKLASGQIALLASYVIIQSHLSIEFGPIVQVNGKLNLDSSKENNVIYGTTLLAKDIKAISNFNFYPTVGLTFGVRHFRANVSYQYGVNNMLENLNNKNLGVNFKGSPGILNGNLIIYL
ncbi:hypothetical protein SAMN05444395_101431 [Flavobacterium fryxellicola]|uniref:Outer membrane protein beta-barrel domain-containing protein n=1 Tax=Flavobacterium fryxellicola TaxID=249352 RepID=A0A167XL22_9FLAO|nr:hypothetical protein [Flavobacterium fryxellicola]OAB28474.1 hypothetical protein FBFR_07165 [Flavobacterium fryxellicola]SHN52729.1 hypothetical protein SAMN05444395_101431 [Flavobacterium fryxellicola]